MNNPQFKNLIFLISSMLITLIFSAYNGDIKFVEELYIQHATYPFYVNTLTWFGFLSLVTLATYVLQKFETDIINFLKREKSTKYSVIALTGPLCLLAMILKTSYTSVLLGILALMLILMFSIIRKVMSSQ